MCSIAKSTAAKVPSAGDLGAPVNEITIQGPMLVGVRYCLLEYFYVWDVCELLMGYRVVLWELVSVIDVCWH